MDLMWTLTIVVCVLLILAVVAAIGRFLGLRSKGVSVVVRPLPSPAGRHWRHGALIYSEEEVKVYKLRTLQPWPDFTLSRLETEIINRRPVSDDEAHVLEQDLHVVELRSADMHWEMAVDQRSDTALVAWLESRPSERRVR